MIPDSPLRLLHPKVVAATRTHPVLTSVALMAAVVLALLIGLASGPLSSGAVQNQSISIDDGDGWSDAAEGVIGTDPLDACADDAADNAWPADMNNDTFVDVGDVGMVTNHFGEAVPPAPARVNVAPDPPDGFVDTRDIGRIAGLFGQGCGLSGGALATFSVVGEAFKAWVTNPQTIQQLIDLRDGKSNARIPNGRILARAGQAAHNAPWSWHVDPVDVTMAEAAIEVCDATPSYVEANRDYLIQTVGRYCPWSAQLVDLVDYR